MVQFVFLGFGNVKWPSRRLIIEFHIINNPNIGFESIKGCNMVIFKTLRKIKKGEELLINYDDF